MSSRPGFNIYANPYAAFVVDDLVTEPSWTPRGVTVRGRAVIHPERGERLGRGFGPIWSRSSPSGSPRGESMQLRSSRPTTGRSGRTGMPRHVVARASPRSARPHVRTGHPEHRGRDGHKIPVTPEQLHGAEREEAWRQITAAAPSFAQYQQKTDRDLPVIASSGCKMHSSVRGTHQWYPMRDFRGLL